MAGKMTILVLDDQADAFEKRVKLLPDSLRRGVVVRHPKDVTLADIENAKLVLVDYRLDEWKANSNEPLPSRRIPNGIALLSVLQQHAMTCREPTAFAIHSEHLGELTKPFMPGPRVHLLAWTYNIDWAFVKAPKNAPTQTFEKAQIFAKAVSKLPNAWPEKDPDGAREIARKLLAVPKKQDWSDQGWRDVENACPPLDEMTLRIHGLLFLRWLSTRILYYPCFLVNRFWLAARLGATPESVDSALAGELARVLNDASYTGILQGLPGRRWWRSGVESILWDVGNSESLGTPELQRVLKEKHRIDLESADHPYPEVCLDADYKPHKKLYDPSQTVRLQLDDWPAHADVPRTTIALAKEDKRLGALVIAADRKLLDE